ncbi:biotin--protein ligase isoform X1 [Esox lucius]|uniref:BPL/LPL catalytic domain-containing protein n=2 Tax=Esox lucius TaxID=8010 RepID=A0A3P9A1Y4_ESOLU|nr:biotin--protein ligase isoform X1 [Esox lucius]
MLITLCYVYLWVRFQKCYTVVIRSTLHRLCGESKTSASSFAFCALNPSEKSLQKGHSTCQSSVTTTFCPPLPEEDVFLKLGDKAIYITEPQACDDLSKWTLLWGSSLSCGPRIENISFIIEATSGQRVGSQAPHHTTKKKKVLRWSDYCLPLACSPVQPFRAVAQASVDNFSRLGVAFMEDRLQLDNGLVPSKIVSVLLRESALKELLEKGKSVKHITSLSLKKQTEVILSEPSPCEWEVLSERGDASQTEHRKGSLLLLPEVQRLLGERRGSEPLRGTRSGVDSEDNSLGNNHQHMEGHGHHLHLSSCHECLELENSTILSVKYASVDNIPDLPDDFATCTDSGDETLDEFEEDAAESFVGQSRRVNVSGKPPNVLVYTGGCQERFQRVRSLVGECIDMYSYTVYPLRPQQALSEPWLESAALLILASDDPLTPQLQARFLAYLELGGKILGLSSTLCPTGLALVPRESRRRQICRLNFTRADSTELDLSVLASGNVFIREPQSGGGGETAEVESWGELKGGGADDGDKDMVIVRVTTCDGNGGEAVLCQVHLEIAPDSEDIASLQGFDELKISNMRRYEVLTEILTSLGLRCELSQAPPPSPVYILSTSEEHRACFLKWLHTQVDKEGLLKSSKASLKVVSGAELQAGPPLLPEGTLALVTDPPVAQSCEYFSLHTYNQHLQTRRLGHTVLYAHVIPTTMDLLERLMLQLPEEIGLVAVAAQQTQGKGRGENAWLSPLGCAMFSVHVQVAVSSRLGQRISFLQHLAALAVVEAVRTLPGYQDIDLRVKWPNDIYYSNLMKLGGVLVKSTVMGPTFYLLIGCGFNVSNSNPTICINDLVMQHNREHGTSLEALSSAQLIGRTLTFLEELICAFQEQGSEAVLPLYYKRWVHSGTQVRLWSEDGPHADVVGVDDNGFLQVRSEEQGVVSVQPDGNSFDMLRNLVVVKQR